MTTYSADYYRNVPVAVLGASGFIGRWVARALCLAGARVQLLVRDPAGSTAIFKRYGIEGRIHLLRPLEGQAPLSCLEPFPPAIVFNAVGHGIAPEERDAGSGDAGWLLNTELPALVVRALANLALPPWRGCRVVHLGSVAEYGQIGGALAETGIEVPMGRYAEAKLAGTRAFAAACKETGLHGLTARLSQVYGPGEPPGRLLPMLIRAAAPTGQVEPMTTGTQQKDFCYVEDVAEGVLRLGAVQGDPGEVVNLVTGRLASVREFAQTAARLLRLPDQELRFVKPVGDNELRHGPIANERLRGLIGWVPSTGIEEGIRRTIAFGDG